ncbi:MAG TPA: hypothetical protein VGI67_19325 [Thermoleophilaceae bacterium]|jgi:hypothetical protein
MTIWLTLLLVWTTGIPAALFMGAAVATGLLEWRIARLASLAAPKRLHRSALATCGHRARPYSRLVAAGARPLRQHAGTRRPV